MKMATWTHFSIKEAERRACSEENEDDDALRL